MATLIKKKEHQSNDEMLNIFLKLVRAHGIKKSIVRHSCHCTRGEYKRMKKYNAYLRNKKN